MKKIFSIWLIVVAFAIIGEVRCIYRFCTSDFKPSYKRELIYGVGMVAGYGIIMGYIPEIKDTPETSAVQSEGTGTHGRNVM